MAWDMTSATAKGHCATSVSSCPPSGSTCTTRPSRSARYGKSALWKIVDGPWQLTSYQTTGQSVFTPNKSYSGPVKPHLAEFIETPFTTEDAELNVLRSGQISVGYLPITDLAQRPVIQRSGYNLSVWLDAGINYFPENFNNPTVGPIFRQLYFRAGHAAPDQPAPVHQQDLAGLRLAHLRAGADPAGQPVRGQLREGQPVPVQRVGGQVAADQQRLDGAAGRRVGVRQAGYRRRASAGRA